MGDLLFGSKTCVTVSQSTFDSMPAINDASISVNDKSVGGLVMKEICETQQNGIQRAFDQAKDWAIREGINQAQKVGDIGYKAALRMFLNTLAYDTATYLATGDKGQKPMFETEGWGAYLKNVADSAAGAALEDIGKKNGLLKFNLCQPDPKVLLKINLGLNSSFAQKPKAPACTFSQLTKNWDTAIKSKDFLPKFQDMFNPWSNDLGIALTLQTGVESEISKQTNAAIQQRLEGQGFKKVTDAISGAIKTPANLVREYAAKPVQDSTAAEKVYTGSIVADSIDVFVNTLIGKLMDKWLKKGIVTNFAGSGNLSDPNAQNINEGASGAEERFRSLTEPNFKVRGDYDILAELSACPDPNKAGPTNCVVDEKFRQAIEQRMTVKQAMDQGYLNGNGIFGFTANGLEPKFNEGYPYRSMLILRKFRIIPVGWEIAAQKIKDRQPAVGGTKNLSALVNCSADWCAGLVDGSWVLKAPQNFCKREGAGPEIISSEAMGEGAASAVAVLRNDTYCADEQSCIKEKADGSCQFYGYCTEEKRKWDFNAKTCEPRNNTCKTFRAPGGQTVSYLENTLDYGSCTLKDAGCKAYCAVYNYTSQKFSCAASGGNKLYLNGQAETCAKEAEGCRQLIRPGKDGAATTTIYEKIAPDYLAAACAGANPPADCGNFARFCAADEAGCALYTGEADGLKVPAKIAPADYCPAECVGYNAFLQNETNFDFSGQAYFIPKSATACTAQAAGCDQFTNLDEVARGGEGVEYYTYLRQCLKKTGNESSCGDFYTWEGSDESGYQLKVESLKKSGSGAATEPALSQTDGRCDDIYNLSASNPAYNPDCRQYYNRDGSVFYRLSSRTISCSDDCHPYRLTGINYDDSAASAAACAGADRHWDAAAGRCQACKNGGVWSAQNNACIYQAVPGRGLSCSAAQSGCREYTGNTGNNLRKIFTDDFSDGTAGKWVALGGSQVAPSNQSLTLGPDNIGHSLKVTASSGAAAAKRPVGGAVSSGRSYVVNLVIKADAAADLSISLINAAGQAANFSAVRLTAGWQIVSASLASLNYAVSADESLTLSAGADFYVNNISLTEITDRYYLIKNSWRTPASCLKDITGAPRGVTYNLGCARYADKDGKNHNLRQFSSLCLESAVGCEAMIDTQNSSAEGEEYYLNGVKTAACDPVIAGCVKVPADRNAYIVYDETKQCGAEDKGCQFLGQPYAYSGITLYGGVYLKNNPDSYGEILCGTGSAGCQTYAFDGGQANFKDPGDQVCEWRLAKDKGETPDWYKKKVKRCLPAGQAGGASGTVCLSDADCLSGSVCQLESTDQDCPTADNKTLGLGGPSGVEQPGGGWAGLCPAADSGCSEYLDPISNFNPNLIFNGSFQKLASSPTDGWGAGLTQNVSLEPKTVYRLARSAEAGALTISGCPAGSLNELGADNQLSADKAAVSVPSGAAASRIFYFNPSVKVGCTITASSPNGEVGLKKASVAYQLAQNLDRSSCNGIINTANNCILFNERKQSGAALAGLTWDADASASGGAPALGTAAADNDSNIIIKAAPDRACDKWLACKSYVKDDKGNNVCYDVGLCDAVDDNGNCLSFLISDKANQLADNLGGKISNLSGYAKAGIAGGSLSGDYYPLGAMKQSGDLAEVANGGFEYYGSNGYPMGWTPLNLNGQQISWNSGEFSVISNPVAAQAEGVDYPVEGRSFLKFSPSLNIVSSEFIDVEPETEYFVSFKINTANFHTGAGFETTVSGISSQTFNSQGEPTTASQYSGATTDLLECNGTAASQPWRNGCAATAASGSKGWEQKVFSFKTGQFTHKIKLRMYGHVYWGRNECASASNQGGRCVVRGLPQYDCAPSHGCTMPGGTIVNDPCGWGNTITMTSDACGGNVYFDDIKIRPALNSKTGWNTMQTCRLYPKSDSLACDYYEDAGTRQKGWYGYCLEYDRPPGNPNACILWYPIDKVKGDGVEEGMGYQGKMPVYYSLAGTTVRFAEYRHVYYFGRGNWDGCNNVPCAQGYKCAEWDLAEKTGWDTISAACYPNGENIIVSDGSEDNVRTDTNPTSENDGWYPYDGIQSVSSYWIGSDNKFVQELCGNTTGCSKDSEFFRTKLYATQIAQTVNSVGQNKFWSSRVYKGTDHKILGTNISYNNDSAPFGSMVPPAPVNNPYEWDGDTAQLNNQPVYYNTADSGKARMGQAYGCAAAAAGDCQYVADLSAQDYYPYKYIDMSAASGIDAAAQIKRIFAQSYGAWSWSGASDDGRYEPTDSGWGVPGNPCRGTGAGPRPAYPNDLCGITPVVKNIKINGSVSGADFKENGFANLTFNTAVDGDQLPLVMYKINWGDGEITAVSGVEMRDRPAGENPHSLYHLYSYWDLRAKAASGVSSISCTASQCSVKPKIQIKDNWGWCNRSTTSNACAAGQWDSYAGVVTVSER